MARVSMLLFGREFWEEIINWKGLAEAGTISEKNLGLIRYEKAVKVIDGWRGEDYLDRRTKVV